MTKDTGGPAFPFSPSDVSTVEPQLGMTLRDYFAGTVLPATLTTLWAQGQHDTSISDTAAKFAYEVADSMLRARHRVKLLP